MRRLLLSIVAGAIVGLISGLSYADSTVPALSAATSLTTSSTYLAQGGTTDTKVGYTTSVFDISAGAITLKAGGVANSMLANAATTVNGTTCTLGSSCTPAGLISVSGGGNTTTGVTTVAFGNGFVATPNGAGATSTVNLTLTDATKSADYSVAAGDMANALTLTGAHALTLPVVSSTIFQPGMSLSIANTGSGNWTVTNSTGLTTNLISPMLPGTNGTLVANANGTALDFFGLQTPTATALGGVLSSTCATHNFSTGISTAAAVTCGQPAIGDISGLGTGVATALGNAVNTNGGVLTASTAAIAANAIVTGAGSGTALTGTTPGTGVLTALGVNTGSAGAFLLNTVPRGHTAGWVATVNPNNALVFIASNASTITSITGNVETATGSAATVSVYKAPSGTACSAGTILHSGSFNANGTAATNQTLTLVGGATDQLAAGDRVCFQTTGTTAWTGGTGIGGITVSITVP